MEKQKKGIPEWVPENAGLEFTTTVIDGLESKHDGMDEGNMQSRRRHVRKKLELKDYVKGIWEQDKVVLARAITLVESNSSEHILLAQELIREILPNTGKSIRIGITGVPGAGKSTLIEALGIFLISLGHKVAVLAVDPTSSLSKGSILGDKTRMEILSRNDKCFIRPSPSGGTLGGVTKKTRETTLLCEAAGYDVIIIETVGVGQSEITVRSMVDFFLLLKIAGAGDELQGIKRGIMELVDAIVINKADGENIPMAEMAKNEFERAIHYLKPVTEKWIPQVLTCSAVENRNIDSIWDIIMEFEKATKESGFFLSRRNKQLKDWLHAMIQEYLQNSFYRNPAVSEVINKIETEIIKGEKPVTKAVQELIYIFNQANVKDKSKNFK